METYIPTYVMIELTKHSLYEILVREGGTRSISMDRGINLSHGILSAWWQAIAWNNHDILSFEPWKQNSA